MRCDTYYAELSSPSWGSRTDERLYQSLKGWLPDRIRSLGVTSCGGASSVCPPSLLLHFDTQKRRQKTRLKFRSFGNRIRALALAGPEIRQHTTQLLTHFVLFQCFGGDMLGILAYMLVTWTLNDGECNEFIIHLT